MIEKIKETNSNAIEENQNFIENDKFFIYGYFDFTIAKYIIPGFIKRIDDLRNIKDASISLFIDSGGGYTSYLKNLLALVEAAKSIGITVETFVFAQAYSCASILASSGTKGRRFIGPHAEHLLHLGASETGKVQTDIQMERSSNRVKAHFNFVRSCYKKYGNVKKLDELLKDDNYFLRGKEIIKNGLADYILGE